jgi:hypothetical protein
MEDESKRKSSLDRQVREPLLPTRATGRRCSPRCPNPVGGRKAQLPTPPWRLGRARASRRPAGRARTRAPASSPLGQPTKADPRPSTARSPVPVHQRRLAITRRQARALARVSLSLAHPLAQRLGRGAELGRHRLQRGPLRWMRRALLHRLGRPIDPILPRTEVSEKVGALQSGRCRLCVSRLGASARACRLFEHGP